VGPGRAVAGDVPTAVWILVSAHSRVCRTVTSLPVSLISWSQEGFSFQGADRTTNIQVHPLFTSFLLGILNDQCSSACQGRGCRRVQSLSRILNGQCSSACLGRGCRRVQSLSRLRWCLGHTRVCHTV